MLDCKEWNSFRTKFKGEQLTGIIESFPGSCDLRTLDLNGNFLQGKLPKCLSNCAMLEILDVGSNKINDEFPCWLKSIPTLHVVVLRSNRFHGSLECPGTQIAWPHLQIVDLAHNSFSGKIPPAFLIALKVMPGGENDGKLLKTDPLQFELDEDYIDHYYRDEVNVTSKNLEMELVKIQNIFTSIDLSSNKFEGPIPVVLGQLRALYILNLSRNALSGKMPSSFGTLKLLESLDLSNNSLSGEIPKQMANLSFLAFLNLSYNHLTGRIPASTQIQSFEASSFIGNDGLCGPPLTPNCSNDERPGVSQSPIKKSHSESSIDWNFISAELGFVFGIVIVLLPLAFWKAWRIWYWQHVDDLLYRIFPLWILCTNAVEGQITEP
ncbi:receptor-like protein 33 [Prosopis cineraria]|uniref:receptor-like protein 33 n=1 Tax=Prosopis cineraria TaxID=364024 RepID=UPI00240F9900|nr:receptor-like protein 33 [Prosopis cineraria]